MIHREWGLEDKPCKSGLIIQTVKLRGILNDSSNINTHTVLKFISEDGGEATFTFDDIEDINHAILLLNRAKADILRGGRYR